MGRGRKKRSDFVPKPWKSDSSDDQDPDQQPLEHHAKRPYHHSQEDVDQQLPEQRHVDLQRELQEQLQLENTINEQHQRADRVEEEQIQDELYVS